MSEATKPEAPADDWPKPVEIDRAMAPVFPVDALPEPLRSWCVATAEATQTPVDMAALLSLAICAGAMARRVEVIAGRGWREPVNLYVAVLMEPANRKSAVFAAATKPLREIERRLIEQAAPEIARLMSDRRVKESSLKAAEKQASTTGCPEARETAQRLAEELAMEPVPALPKLVVDDATSEAIEVALMAQGGRLVVAGAEGGLFDVMAGRYSSGVGNFDVFLCGHANEDRRIERVGRGSIVVERCCLTLCYAVQPDVIRGLAEKPSFRGRGLIGRFLYAVPESRLGKRRIDPEPVPESIDVEYVALVQRLAMLNVGNDEPVMVTMGPDAAGRFRSWQSEVELMLAEDARLAAFRDWGGKLCGLTARLAAVMQMIGNHQPEPWRDPISVETLAAAIKLARWAIPHAESMLELMTGGDGAVDDARYLLRWIREHSLNRLTRRDAHNHGRRRFDGEPERLDTALILLVDRGWLRAVPGGMPDGPGRPPSPLFDVHPEALRSNVAPVVLSVPESGRSSGRKRGVI